MDWGRVPWSDPYINIISELRELPDSAVIVMLGSAPMAYVIPHFPSTTRFIRPEGNLRLQNNQQFFRNIQTIIDHQKASGRLFVLFHEEDRSVNLEASSIRLGVDLSQLDCFLLKINSHDRLKLCHVMGEKN